jgi:hypothetical protein
MNGENRTNPIFNLIIDIAQRRLQTCLFLALLLQLLLQPYIIGINLRDRPPTALQFRDDRSSGTKHERAHIRRAAHAHAGTRCSGSTRTRTDKRRVGSRQGQGEFTTLDTLKHALKLLHFPLRTLRALPLPLRLRKKHLLTLHNLAPHTLLLPLNLLDPRFRLVRDALILRQKVFTNLHLALKRTGVGRLVRRQVPIPLERFGELAFDVRVGRCEVSGALGFSIVCGGFLI